MNLARPLNSKKKLVFINKTIHFFQEFAETSLHYAISHETGHSLHIVDFIVQVKIL